MKFCIVDDEKWQRGGENIVFTTETVQFKNKDVIKERKCVKLSFEFVFTSVMKKVYFAYSFP